MPGDLTIDMHTHIVPRECIPFEVSDPRTGRAHGIRLGDGGCGVVVDGQPMTNANAHLTADHVHDVDLRLREMDRQRVDVQAISVAPYLYYYFAAPTDGLRHARRLNDAIARIVRSHPDRFVGLATVPLQDVPAAITELERAVGELGMRGVEIGTNVNGLNPDEEQFFPFFQKVQELNVVITFHPSQVAGQRLGRYYLQNLMGIPVDHGIAITSLIFGGVLERLPHLKLVFFHGGGMAPFVRGRWAHGYEVRPEPKEHCPRPPDDYFGRLYFDTITHGLPQLQFLLDTVGADRMVIGTDFPYDMGDYQPLERIEALTGLSRAERQLIRGGNAATLLKLA